MDLNRIYNMDCLEGMKEIPDESIDCIICDLPYGTTACAWDSVIPFAPLWEQYKRIRKPYAPICLFGSEPFSTLVRMSNLNEFKYDWIWVKSQGSGFVHAKNQPLKNFEVISMFCSYPMGHISQLGDKRMPYNPQGLRLVNKLCTHGKERTVNVYGSRPSHKDEFIREYENYPNAVIKFSSEREGRFHPTQKPVELIRYLIRTYSNPGDTILDNCMGSGTTAVAAVMEKRKFIGFETNKEYFDKANDRLKQLTGPFYIYGNIGV